MWLALIDASHNQIKVLTAVAHLPQLLWFKEKNGRMGEKKKYSKDAERERGSHVFTPLEISEEIELYHIFRITKSAVN